MGCIGEPQTAMVASVRLIGFDLVNYNMYMRTESRISFLCCCSLRARTYMLTLFALGPLLLLFLSPMSLDTLTIADALWPTIEFKRSTRSMRFLLDYSIGINLGIQLIISLNKLLNLFLTTEMRFLNF